MSRFIRAYAQFTIVLAVCYSTFNFAGEQALVASSFERPEVDLSDVVISGVSRDGEGTYVLETLRLQRFSSKTSEDIAAPRVVQTHKSGFVRRMSADHGEYTRATRTLYLFDNVVIEETTAGQSVPVMSKLNSLTVRLDEF